MARVLAKLVSFKDMARVLISNHDCQGAPLFSVQVKLMNSEEGFVLKKTPFTVHLVFFFSKVNSSWFIVFMFNNSSQFLWPVAVILTASIEYRRGGFSRALWVPCQAFLQDPLGSYRGGPVQSGQGFSSTRILPAPSRSQAITYN